MKEKILLILNELKSIFIPEREEDPLRDLRSAETIRNERFKKYKRRIMSLVIFGPIFLFIVFVAVKSFFIYRAQFDQTKVTETIPKKDLKLEFNTFTRWQEIKDQEDEKLNNEIKTLSVKVDDVKKEVGQKIDGSNKMISDNLESIKTSMQDSFVKNQEDMKQIVSNERNQSKDEINNVIDNFNVQLKTVEEKVTTQLKDLSVSSNGSIDIKLPPLNNLPDTNKNLEDKKMFTDSKNLVDNNMILENDNGSKYQEEEPDSQTYSINTLDNFKEKDKNKEDTMPKFTIMPGFLKGVIVAGADVPTLEQSPTEPKPIWLSVNSEQLIANGKSLNLKDCLIEAVATGDIGTKRGRFALKQLSCSLSDLAGVDYKIITAIKGNVYGEDGKIGAKGRLVSREGEIIEKGIPLAALEGIIQSLSKTNNYIYPSGANISNSPNPIGDFADAGSTTGSKILGKFSEYYLKVLESLNPYVEIKAKRVVTIAISDPVEVTPAKYTPFDVNYFVEKDLLKDQDEEDY